MADIDLETRSFIVRGNTLIPADVHAEAWMAKRKQGQEVGVRLWAPRNMKQHRLFFAILRRVVRNSDFWQDEAALRDAVSVAVGHTELRQKHDGTYEKRAASISVASMPGDAFQRFLNRALYVLIGISGMTEEELLRSPTRDEAE